MATENPPEVEEWITACFVHTPFPVVGGAAWYGGVVFLPTEHGMVLVSQEWFDDVICDAHWPEHWQALLKRLEELEPLPQTDVSCDDIDEEPF